MKGRSIRFILVRPSNALNMGAVARAMANFGLDDLAVVAPYAPRWRAANSAKYGSALLRKARLSTLEKELADRHLVLGTASAHNRAQVRTEVTLPQLAPWLKKRLPKGGKLAVLFGSERNGLTNAELSRCHAVLRIPTEPDAPSMNLGQAAALAAYDLTRSSLERSVTDPDDLPASAKELSGLEETALRAMSKVRVNANLTDAARREKLRKGFLRWDLNRGDVAFLRGLLRKLT